jgi:hypothetical protein
MGLDGYRIYRQEYIDTGEELPTVVISESDFVPDFKNSNTMQTWSISASLTEVNIKRWLNDTLADRSAHTIQIINNAGGNTVKVNFSNQYVLNDDTVEFDSVAVVGCSDNYIEIESGKTAFFYATAINKNKNIILILRKGTQDTR